MMGLGVLNNITRRSMVRVRTVAVFWGFLYLTVLDVSARVPSLLYGATGPLVDHSNVSEAGAVV